MNPRAAINDLLPFQGSPFGQLGYFSTVRSLSFLSFYNERRGWDSNPRALADKRFSRPPRYDHFDTSPLVFDCFLSADASVILPKLFFRVNNFFQFFHKFFHKICQLILISCLFHILVQYMAILYSLIFLPQKQLGNFQIFRRCQFYILITAFNEFHFLICKQFSNHSVIRYGNSILCKLLFVLQ